MTVNLVQWHAVIGIFNCQSSAMSHHVCNLTKNFVLCLTFRYFVSIILKVLLSFCLCWCICLLFYNVMETMDQIQEQGN